jgi:hypothetical protein
MNCRGSAKTADCEEGTQVETGTAHNHAPSPTRIDAARINNNIRRSAIDSRGNTPRTAVNECLAGASNNAIAALPQLISLEKSVARKRRHEGVLKIPHSLEEINIPENLKISLEGAMFLLHFSGAEDPGRILLFSTELDSSRLASCDTWLADGTFRSAPAMCLQLWVVHGIYRGAFCLFVFVFFQISAKKPTHVQCSFSLIVLTPCNPEDDPLIFSSTSKKPSRTQLEPPSQLPL